ncbi:hypothetical protein NKJ72_25395 [Mesorhizobium sp. M0045]|uniref:hypothetical protein n=1 Tax=unclassified Mesorhizobium TaxID=325217 RepID=UPI00333B72E4
MQRFAHDQSSWCSSWPVPTAARKALPAITAAGTLVMGLSMFVVANLLADGASGGLA